ncbi:hypothetical protein ES703_80460 [subsurface metagenome]
MTVEEWNRAFLRVLPVASLGLGVSTAAMTVMSLRSRSLAQRVSYEDSQYLVSVRYPGQWRDIREFVQPSNPDVMAVYSQIGPDVWANLDFVCRNIDYRRDTGEFWQFPSETLKGYGDCEDSSILFTSLLRNFTNGHVALGSYQGYGHAWCQLDGQIFETTFTRARPVPDPENYLTFALFDEREAIELWSGALDDLFRLRRNEATKLSLMAAASGEC